jgi:hypothetical protein
MQHNLTLALDAELILKAQALAARRNCSISALLRDELARLVAEDEAYEAAKRAALERLARSAHLGGGPLPTRDELHDHASRQAFKVIARDLGNLRPGLSPDNVAELIEQLDGPLQR